MSNTSPGVQVQTPLQAVGVAEGVQTLGVVEEASLEVDEATSLVLDDVSTELDSDELDDEVASHDPTHSISVVSV